MCESKQNRKTLKYFINHETKINFIFVYEEKIGYKTKTTNKTLQLFPRKHSGSILDKQVELDWIQVIVVSLKDLGHLSIMNSSKLQPNFPSRTNPHRGESHSAFYSSL